MGRLGGLLLLAVLLAAAAAAADEQAFKPPVEAGYYEALARRLSQAEAELARRILEPAPYLSDAELRGYQSLHQEIQASFYGELVDRSRFLVLLTQTLAAAPALPGAPQGPVTALRPNLARPAGVLLGTAAVSFGLSFGCWALAERQEVLRLNSATPDEATSHRKLYVAWAVTSLILAGLGTISSGVSASLLLAGGR